MGKKDSKTKKRKPFNPIRNVEKLHELKQKLRKNKSNSNEEEPGASSSATGENNKHFSSEKEREIILHIMDLFSSNSDMVEYREKLNAIILTMKGKIGTHHLLITYIKNVLLVVSLKGIYVNCSDSFFEYIMTLNSQISMGCFYYLPRREQISYKYGIPLDEKPEKEYLEGIIAFVCNLLDECIPEVLSHIAKSANLKKENTSPTFH